MYVVQKKEIEWRICELLKKVGRVRRKKNKEKIEKNQNCEKGKRREKVKCEEGKSCKKG